MKKIISILFGVLIMTSLVYGEVYVGIGVETEQDLYAEIDLKAQGDMTVYINGLDYYKEQQILNRKIGETQMSIDGVFWQIADVFMNLNRPTNQWEYTDSNDLYTSAQNLQFVFNTYFVPRYEYNNKIQSLELEIATLKRFFNEEELCSARVEVATEYGIDEISCNGDVATKTGDIFVVLSDIPKTQEELDTKEYEENLKVSIEIEKYQEMQKKQNNNTQSYIKKICPTGNWTQGKCIGGNK